MMKPVVSAGILLLLATAPALAVGANCEAQLKSTAAMMAQKSGAKAALEAKLEAKQGEAEQLCKAGQDEQAQELARQIRNELSGQGSGSSTPQKPAPPEK